MIILYTLGIVAVKTRKVNAFFSALFIVSGLEESELSDLDYNLLNSVDSIPDVIMDRLKKSVTLSKDRKLLKLWLSWEYNIPISVIER